MPVLARSALVRVLSLGLALTPFAASAQPAATPAAAQPAAAQPAPDEATLAQARERFTEGMRLAETGNCAGAIEELEASYALVPRPNTLYNIAQCHERMFRYDLAIASYERYLREATPTEEDRAAVQAAMATLGNLLGTIRVQSNVPAEVWVDDHLSGQAPGNVLVPGGQHTVELRAERYLPARQEVRVAARATVAATFTLRRAEHRVTIREETGLDPWLFWTGAGATVVVAGVGAFFGVRALSLSADARDAHDAEPRLSYATEAQDIDDAALLADVFFASAGVLAVGTTIVFFLTKWGDSPPAPRPGERAPSASALRVAPALGPSVAGLSLSGGF